MRHDGLFTAIPPFPRFLRRIGPADARGCWPWLGQTLPKGYGLFWSGERKTLAHRWIYEAHFGKAPRGMVIMHTCDNPNCVNPNHLRLGTYRENTADMWQKGRAKRHKLTDAQAAEIRARHSGKWGDGALLAREYGISKANVSAIIHGRSWRVDVEPAA